LAEEQRSRLKPGGCLGIRGVGKIKNSAARKLKKFILIAAI